MLSDVESAYFAGAIDCDGSIQVMVKRGPQRKSDGHRPNYYLVRVSLTQVDPTLPTLLKAGFGGSVYRYDRPNGGKGYWHVWSVSTGPSRVCLTALRPYLHQKRQQADSALRLCDLLATQRSGAVGRNLTADEEHARFLLMQEVRALNGRVKAGRNQEILASYQASQSTDGHPAEAAIASSR